MPTVEISHGRNVHKEAKISLDPESELEVFTRKVLYVVTIMRLNFIEPAHWSISKVVNAMVTTLVVLLACYSLIYTMHITFTMMHSPLVMSSKLLLIAWGIQSIVSLAFLVYWQLSGHMRSFQQNVVECQHGFGIRHGRNMFYYPQLRFINSFITLYLYVAWNASMFIYIIYTNAAYLEVKYFNDQLEKLDGAADDVEYKLLNKMEVYGRLCCVIRELDRIFKLYAFIMLVIIIPSVIFTLMMLNHQMHSLRDLVICLPSTALCAYSFLGVTVAPARLHDEVFTIAQVLASHMEQYDLGISIWGFAVLSRPLVLAVMCFFLRSENSEEVIVVLEVTIHTSMKVSDVFRYGNGTLDDDSTDTRSSLGQRDEMQLLKSLKVTPH
ncbi:hypothetical protein ANCCEY_03352 [Ancylostoma ceylanicum]|uniref:Gustatory receptor n=1 Tax=Ancylostoma ceylanicum TaxID=53326 RepID=A0A0D6M0H9_9BILA|nr:hypothetical protein ANCCEY_03352 [Ancylostoma ceylanicum]